jgi:hypothetical protein
MKFIKYNKRKKKLYNVARASAHTHTHTHIYIYIYIYIYKKVELMYIKHEKN